MKERKTRAVIFDMDGLMFDSERIVKLSWSAAGDVLGYERLGDNIVNTLGMNVISREQYFKKTYGEDFPFERFSELTKIAFTEYTEEHGLPVKEGLYELLYYLEAHNYKTAVASSSREAHIMRNLKNAGLEHRFDAVLNGGMVKRSKPDPEIYRKTCEALRIRPEQGLVLEDAPGGVKAAHAAEIPVVVIPDLVEPDEEILGMALCRKNSLLDIIDLLEKWD